MKGLSGRWIILPAVIVELGKFRVTAAVSITTATGYLLAGGKPDLNLLWTLAGIFLLAAGSSALNQVQERNYDRLMPRTLGRPIPSGRAGVSQSLIISMLYLSAGSALLVFSAGWASMGLAWLAVFWYNGVYTYLKRITPHAVIPGSLVGAIPPLVGWTAAGGVLNDPRLVPLLVFFFIWQVPHFYLLVLKYGEEYAAAGYPSLLGVHPRKHIYRLVFLWIFGTALVTAIMPFTGLLGHGWFWIPYWLGAGLLVAGFFKFLLAAGTAINPGRYFIRINLFVLGVVVLMITESLLR